MKRFVPSLPATGIDDRRRIFRYNRRRFPFLYTAYVLSRTVHVNCYKNRRYERNVGPVLDSVQTETPTVLYTRYKSLKNVYRPQYYGSFGRREHAYVSARTYEIRLKKTRIFPIVRTTLYLFVPVLLVLRYTMFPSFLPLFVRSAELVFRDCS